MDRLSKIAQSIFLGNGEVWNFLDYAVNRPCGGLLTYTKKNNYLINNLHKTERRYNYDDIISYKNYSVKDGAVIEYSAYKGDYIGDVYSVPSEKNISGSLKFITNENFEELNKKIRNTQKYNNSGDVFNKTFTVYNGASKGVSLYENISVESYLGLIDDEQFYEKEVRERENGDTSSINIIDTITTNDKFGEKFSFSSTFDNDATIPFTSKENRKTRKYDINTIKDRILDKYKIWRKSTESKTYSNKNLPYPSTSELVFPEFGEKILDTNLKMKSKNITLDAVAEHHLWMARQNESYLKERNNSERGLFGEGYRGINGGNDFYFEKENIVDLVIGDRPIFRLEDNNYEIYTLRTRIISSLSGRNSLYPKNGYGEKILWSPTNVYGIEEKNEKYSTYNIGEKNTLGDEKPISNDFTLGSGSIHNGWNGRVYAFQQENEDGTFPTNLKKSETIEGTIVKLHNYNGASKLLERTGQLFRNAKINSLINRFHTSKISSNSELESAYDINFGLSRGRNLIKKEYEGKQFGDKSTGYDNPYCRVWTAHNQYSKLKHRIRPFVNDDDEPIDIKEVQSNYGALRPYNGAERLSDDSVLRRDGFVRITPTHTDGNFSGIQNYMFSLENLAWKDVITNEGNKSLSKEQKGPNNGRIMWFPPYNLRFSENINVNWNANSFIGRGEEMYTYTNTVRTGTLDFTLLVDHPSILNKWRGMGQDIKDKEEKERDILRFFAGCDNLNFETENEKPKKTPEPQLPKPEEPTPVKKTKKVGYVIFFPNAFSGKDYIKDGNLDGAIEIINGYNNGVDTKVKDFSRYKNQDEEISKGLEDGFFETHLDEIKQILFGSIDEKVELYTINDLMDIDNNFTGDYIYGLPVETCKIMNIELKGFASSHGMDVDNTVLFKKRTDFIKKMICNQSEHFDEENITFTELKGRTIKVLDYDDRNKINNTDARIARAAYAIINLEWIDYVRPKSDKLDESSTVITLQKDIEEKVEENNEREYVNTVEIVENDYTYDNEYMYFAELRKDSLVYKNIVDKVRYFDPAFHSITPEGFNARLTFLHQCTRQGPTNSVNSGRVKADTRDESGNIVKRGSDDYLKFAGNLAFGRAPYCILRIGDFFNTKICIDSISIQYDNDGVRWDMNPEGVGVQPMYANISISFKFLGGQDISKPIERLQNAVTSNFYANTSVYSRHSDNKETYYDAFEDKIKVMDEDKK